MRDPDASAGAPDIGLPPDAGEILIPLARAAISSALGEDPHYPSGQPPWLLAPGASFVTLTKDRALRGCIGSLEARLPLGDDVQTNAVAAAVHDPRFPPLAPAEFDQVAIEVSVLSPRSPLDVTGLSQAYEKLRPGIDGVILEVGSQHRATFLPQVWDELPNPADFLRHLWLKAGVEAGVWHAGTRLYTYAVDAWHERPSEPDRGLRT
ncbi:AmmeMemoRadiSam system protein A [Demequina sp.]|uniref:AmmeMemoRadiSam system protein A n=1 Tax=Demequina sp. TaxID=2050685 RepID=UPI0025BF847B|nr:AmmeMemoRadiSam system protein A [Demequina sp.]